ncbi:hypothetical protein C0Q70_15341 [Pomacea canaliculata]|uniref:protein-tyrosine-phosphatase n=1 Tax=Pomacea canaliculata TaxID=400727 RepID=A0A2T7NUM3_POMCA|nr:hypothetical protein C0Q70_15341 [Pomacea canaliculata]
MPSRESVSIMSCDTTDCCSPERLRDEVRNNGKVILLDCRPQVDFCRAHIRGAINVTLPTLMIKRLKRGSLNVTSVIQNNEAKERFTKLCKSHVIVLYDDCSTDLNANPSSVLTLLVKKLRQDDYKVSFLIGGFSTFEERFPEYCQSEGVTDNTILGLCNLRISEDSAYASSESSGGELENTPHMSPFPVEVLPYLYLGNAKNSADLNQLKKNGIHYILNVTPNVPNMFEEDGNFKYLQIPISDHWSQNLSSFFPDAIAFIGGCLTYVGLIPQNPAQIEKITFLYTGYSCSISSSVGDKVMEKVGVLVLSRAFPVSYSSLLPSDAEWLGTGAAHASPFLLFKNTPPAIPLVKFPLPRPKSSPLSVHTSNLRAAAGA